MAVAWMSYTLLVTALLFVAAAAAEFICRALRRPTRFVWLAASCLSVGLSARAVLTVTREPAAIGRPSPTRAVSPDVAAGERGVERPANAPVSRTAFAAQLPMVVRTAVRGPERAITSLATSTSSNVDSPLAGLLLAMALGGIAYLLVAAYRVRRIVGQLEPYHVDGRRVLVSKEFGPALLGIVKPRIVIPEWVLSLTHVQRSVILAHETSHEDARDPALLAFAAMLLALMPWNVALWFAFRRLRLAIEVDCDRRVLAAHTDVRGYGDLLVMVYERTASSRLQLAFVERPSNLEQRIRRLVDHTPGIVSGRAAAALTLAVGLAIAACTTTAPARTKPESIAVVSWPITGLAGTALAEQILPACLQPGAPSANPWLQTVKPTAKRQFPAAVEAPRGTGAVIGLMFDEQCVLRRDTVVTDPAEWKRADSIPLMTLVETVLRETSEFGHGIAAMPTGLPQNEDVTIMQGPVAVRVLDSTHVIIAARRFDAPTPRADELFLITLDHSTSSLTTRTLTKATVMFEKGAVYVHDHQTNDPGLLVARSSSTGLTELRRKPGVTVVDQAADIGHVFWGQRLTLDEVGQLVPTTRCEWHAKACYEVAGCRERRAEYCPTFPFQIIPSVARRTED